MSNWSGFLCLDSRLLMRRAEDALTSSQGRLEQTECRINASLTMLLEAAWTDATRPGVVNDAAAPPLVHQ
jgi:hypothetical protein